MVERVTLWTGESKLGCIAAIGIDHPEMPIIASKKDLSPIRRPIGLRLLKIGQCISEIDQTGAIGVHSVDIRITIDITAEGNFAIGGDHRGGLHLRPILLLQFILCQQCFGGQIGIGAINLRIGGGDQREKDRTAGLIVLGCRWLGRLGKGGYSQSQRDDTG